MNYNSSITIGYNGGYIHSAIIDGNEVIRAQVDPYASLIQVKSIHAAKILISKHVTSGRSLAPKGSTK